MRKLLLASSLLLSLAATGCSNPNMRGSGTDYDTGSNSGYGNEYGRRNTPSGGETDNRSENSGALPDTTPSNPSSTTPSTPPEQ